MAQITILSGSLAGLVLPVGPETFHIGRQASANDLELPDPSISRRHCVIEPVASGVQPRFRIRDLGSANGIRVNDRSTRETELVSGDRIQLGDCVLLFDEADDIFGLTDSGEAMEATATCDATAFPDFPAKPPSENLPDSDRYSDDLRALLGISTECNRLHSVHALQDYFLRTLLPRIPAEYAAAIPIHPTNSDEYLKRRCQYAPDPKNMTLGISRTLVERARNSREAVLFGRKRMAPDLAAIDSVLHSRTESLMVVPAIHADNLRGILYLASAVPDAFDAHHLRLAAAAANILAAALERAFGAEAMRIENERLLSDIRIRHRLLGSSPAIARVLSTIQQVCQTDTTVLISGESGTGKELAAHAIHDNSPRRGPMVAINCAAFTETLIESELFGHERGAFSGALGLKRGVFEQAQNGTLFLDEIGELSLTAQAKLLRVIESREVVRIGGERPVQVDFRLIAATHRSLIEQVRTGKFRQDLFYRLNVFAFAMPPLRDRGQDIIVLAEHFLNLFRQKTSRHIQGFSPDAANYLMRHDWPGNVRELRNALERAVIAGSSPHIEVQDFPEAMATPATANTTAPAAYRLALLEARRRIVLDAFRVAGGKHTKAAQMLAVHPNNLHRMLKELGIRDAARQTQTEREGDT